MLAAGSHDPFRPILEDEMAVVVHGVSAVVARAAESLINGVLAGYRGHSGLHVVAYRMMNGEWRIFIADEQSVEVLDPALSAPILAALGSLR